MKNETLFVRVEDDVYTDITRKATEPEWDRDDTCQNHNLTMLRKVAEKSFYDIQFTPNKVQSDYYLVYALYNTGDSFGRDENQIQFISVYSDYQKAEEVADKLKAWTKAKKEEYEFSTKIEIENGEGEYTKFQFHVSWMGYFEHLRDIEVKRLELR